MPVFDAPAGIVSVNYYGPFDPPAPPQVAAWNMASGRNEANEYHFLEADSIAWDRPPLPMFGPPAPHRDSEGYPPPSAWQSQEVFVATVIFVRVSPNAWAQVVQPVGMGSLDSDSSEHTPKDPVGSMAEDGGHQGGFTKTGGALKSTALDVGADNGGAKPSYDPPNLPGGPGLHLNVTSAPPKSYSYFDADVTATSENVLGRSVSNDAYDGVFSSYSNASMLKAADYETLGEHGDEGLGKKADSGFETEEVVQDASRDESTKHSQDDDLVDIERDAIDRVLEQIFTPTEAAARGAKAGSKAAERQAAAAQHATSTTASKTQVAAEHPTRQVSGYEEGGMVLLRASSAVGDQAGDMVAAAGFNMSTLTDVNVMIDPAIGMYQAFDVASETTAEAPGASVNQSAGRTEKSTDRVSTQRDAQASPEHSAAWVGWLASAALVGKPRRERRSRPR